jgi:hypothetical protein
VVSTDIMAYLFCKTRHYGIFIAIFSIKNAKKRHGTLFEQVISNSIKKIKA